MGQPGGVAHVVCWPSWWCHVQSHAQIPCFCSGTSEVEVAVLAFLYLLVHNLPPTAHAHTVAFGPFSFFYFVTGGDICSDVTLQQGSQVPACLMKGPIPDPFCLPSYCQFISILYL